MSILATPKKARFGIRVAGSMKVDAKMGGVITNAEGETNKDAWGKKSPWVDYSGPVDGETVGITIHAHPSGFGAPCRWHVRTYGLVRSQSVRGSRLRGWTRNELASC